MVLIKVRSFAIPMGSHGLHVQIWRCGSLAPISPNSDFRWKWVVITLRPLYPRIFLNKRLCWFHERVVRFGEEKSLLSFPKIEIRIVLPVTYSLCQLSYLPIANCPYFVKLSFRNCDVHIETMLSSVGKGLWGVALCDKWEYLKYITFFIL